MGLRMFPILCAVAVATASMPFAAASTHGVAREPVSTSEPASPTETGSPTEGEATQPESPEPEPPQPEPEPVAAKPTATPSSKPAPAKPEPELAPTDAEADLPERLSPMQTAGWWTLFGGVSLGTLAGVMAGLAERQEDRALRLSVRFELDTGAQTQFEDVQSEYDSTLRKGRAQAAAGVALAVIGLAAAVAGIAVLGVAGARQRKAAKLEPSARVQWRGAGMQVRF